MAITLPITSRTSSDDNDFADVYGNDAQLVSEIDDRDGNYQTLQTGAGGVPSSVGALPASYPITSDHYVANSVGITQGLAAVYLDSTDFAVTSKTVKLRLRAQVYIGATPPATTVTFGLYPVSGVSAGSFTFGSVTTGSTVAFASPSANTRNQGNSGDFTFPSAGYYVLGVVSSGSIGAILGYSHQLQVRWV